MTPGPEITEGPDMKKIPLGRSGIEVSEWCLGTMTYGSQTPQDNAHRQLDMALEAGIDFLDAAEMYPVNPVKAETVGRTEEIIGNWIEKTGKRDAYRIATKASGPLGTDFLALTGREGVLSPISSVSL